MSGVSSSAAGPGTGEETLQASALGEPSSTTTTMHVNSDVQSGSGPSDNEDPMKDYETVREAIELEEETKAAIAKANEAMAKAKAGGSKESKKEAKRRRKEEQKRNKQEAKALRKSKAR